MRPLLLVCVFSQTNKGGSMAQRRKVSNLLALAVLSVLVERPMHPYEMATVRGTGARTRT